MKQRFQDMTVAICTIANTLGVVSVLSCYPKKQPIRPVVITAPFQQYVDLRPKLRIRVENAYYKKAASRQGAQGYLGTETAEYEVTSRGLRLLSVQSIVNLPNGNIPVDQLISPCQRKHRKYRFYAQVVFARGYNMHGSVLLGAHSEPALDRLSEKLIEPETICRQGSGHCTIFPEGSSVSIEMDIVVNGNSRTVDWGAVLGSVVRHPVHVQLFRLSSGRLLPLEIDLGDPATLKTPLLPGDQIAWN